MSSLMDEISRDLSSVNGLRAAVKSLTARNEELARMAIAYRSMAQARRAKLMRALDGALLVRNLMIAAVAMNVLLALVVGILAFSFAK